jgi:hypothetical protein
MCSYACSLFTNSKPTGRDLWTVWYSLTLSLCVWILNETLKASKAQRRKLGRLPYRLQTSSCEFAIFTRNDQLVHDKSNNDKT